MHASAEATHFSSQAYTKELEKQICHLRQENAELKKQHEEVIDYSLAFCFSNLLLFFSDCCTVAASFGDGFPRGQKKHTPKEMQLRSTILTKNKLASSVNSFLVCLCVNSCKISSWKEVATKLVTAIKCVCAKMECKSR